MLCQVSGLGCPAKHDSFREPSAGPAPRVPSPAILAFTMIELMVVVAIMGVILAAGIPSLYRMMQKEGMRKVTSEVMEVCGKARAQAILRGTPVDIMFYPLEHRLVISGASAPSPQSAEDILDEKPVVTPGAGQSALIPEDFSIEMLDINLSEYRESEWARVRFYPNGMSDEMTLVLRSPKEEYKKITLEVTTGLASIDDVVR
jgi:prepilin-type N-terminal cleavage/methylation domain-containing protein